MNFVQSEFLWFMLLVLALYWARPGRRWQNAVLLVASAVFYGWIHPAWVLLLYGSASLDYAMGRLMVRAPAHKRWWLGISLAGNLGLLATFKYADFFVVNLAAALRALGFSPHLHTLDLLLPAGISFYTFQTMSYTIDVYRGELAPRRGWLDYLVYVSFFPQLVAGPIERAARLLPQLEVARSFSLERLREGFGLAIWGAFQKVVIADTIAPFVDKIYVLRDPAPPLLWAATAGFMLQIYADFAGYTAMARGTARMLGIELVRNFDEPWMAATTPEFWQRWHISLSTWIRDYLLAPLLGEADAIRPARFLWAITVTMVLMGAWHGAGWNFLLFGLYHAGWIALYVWATRAIPPRWRAIPGGRALAIAFHLGVVSLVGMLIFREPDLGRIARQLSSYPLAATLDEWKATAAMAGITVALSLPLVAEALARRFVIPRLAPSRWRWPVQTTTWAVFVLAMGIFYRVTAYDFIYFQF